MFRLTLFVLLAVPIMVQIGWAESRESELLDRYNQDPSLLLDPSTYIEAPTVTRDVANTPPAGPLIQRVPVEPVTPVIAPEPVPEMPAPSQTPEIPVLEIQTSELSNEMAPNGDQPIEREAEPEPSGKEPDKVETVRPIEAKVEAEKPIEAKVEAEKPIEAKVEAEKPMEAKAEAEKPIEAKAEAHKAVPEKSQEVIATLPPSTQPDPHNLRSEFVALSGVSDFSIILSGDKFFPSLVRMKKNGNKNRLLFVTTGAKPAALVFVKPRIQRWLSSQTDKSSVEEYREVNSSKITEIEFNAEPGTYEFYDALSGARGEIKVE